MRQNDRFQPLRQVVALLFVLSIAQVFLVRPTSRATDGAANDKAQSEATTSASVPDADRFMKVPDISVVTASCALPSARSSEPDR